MWLVKVLGVIYLTAVCAAQDPEDVTAVVNAINPIPTPTANVPLQPSLQLQSPWLDVFPSEKVEFRCNVTGSPGWTFIWSKDETEVQDSDPNVFFSEEGSVLTFTAATPTYSGSYSCKGRHKTTNVTTLASNPLKLTVTPNKPKPTVSQRPNLGKMFPGESISFTCTVNVLSGWEYLWYHNGREIQAINGIYTIDSIAHPNNGQYHCKAKRGKSPSYTEESDPATLLVSDPPKASLKLQTPWTDVFKNEIVVFHCEIESPDWTVTWYKNEEELKEDSVVTIDTEEQLLNITSVSKEFEGRYTCRARLKSRSATPVLSNSVIVSVYDDLPKPTVRKEPHSNPMYVGETVKFTCNVELSSGWKYHWYKNENILSETGKTITINLSASDGGQYSCKASRQEATFTNVSVEIRQDVHEISVPLLKLQTPWLDVFPTESVKMNCKMENISDLIYTWHKDGQKVEANNDVSFELNGATLFIKSASVAYDGQYTCNGHLNNRSVSSGFSSGLNLKVYGEKPSVSLTQDPEYELMFPGESVSYSCLINVSSGWEYQWYKDGNPLGSTGNKFTIKSVGTTNQGSYKCRGKRGSNQVFHTDDSQAIDLVVSKNKPKPSMTQKPDADKVYTGESVSFECKVGISSGWRYSWYKDGAQVNMNSSSFYINDASSLNKGTYKCMATRMNYNTEYSDERILHISEIPVPSLKHQASWLDVFPNESVEFSCKMSDRSNWIYTWYKDGQKVQGSNGVTFGSNGATLSMSASTSHRGQYSCSATLDGRSVTSNFSSGLTLYVYDTTPRVILVQNPEYNEMHTGDSVSFICHINVSSGWNYEWRKNGSLFIEPTNNHTIKSVLTESSGSYQCRTKRVGNALFHSGFSENVLLQVKERPQADITLLTGWSEAFSTDSLVLKCEVKNSQDAWNYTWFKEGKQINEAPSERHIVTPQNDPEQSLYTCRGIRTGRPSYSKDSENFKTKNLLFKRRVLISISGCIVAGILAVILGCICLRVFRKPAKDEYKPEEAELFLSMARQKGHDDAPCPLVEYITDAALNSPAKEGDENGTICSETTPLPISSQEEQAATTESQETKENNSGLVSFKQ